MDAMDLERHEDGFAAAALAARRKIEGAVDIGELPSWVLEACERWERAALAYGAAMARRSLQPRLPAPPVTSALCH